MTSAIGPRNVITSEDTSDRWHGPMFHGARTVTTLAGPMFLFIISNLPGVVAQYASFGECMRACAQLTGWVPCCAVACAAIMAIKK
jgi:hypothetical protein